MVNASSQALTLTKHSKYLIEDIMAEVLRALIPHVVFFTEHAEKSWCIEREEELVRGLRRGIDSIL